ncbi:MAG TPA: hypothetical protein VG984_01740 [Candidatus Paceibacterota bacterium]|nr:hypothetical protein [Candidatus Paceibacterota bacterium]
MRTQYVPVLIIALAVLVGGYLIARSHTPVANAEVAAEYAKIPTASGKALFMAQSKNLTESVDPTIVDLDSQLITCAPNVDSLLSTNPSIGGSCVADGMNLASTTGMYLGGQCCGPMKDLTEYNEELKNLQQYKDIPDVPMNPYKTSIGIAKKWIDYDNATMLTPQEQVVMDQAMKTSKEGPCCCKCWHYFVNEGIAKKMIKDYHYSAQQIAAYWDTSSIC